MTNLDSRLAKYDACVSRTLGAISLVLVPGCPTCVTVQAIRGPALTSQVPIGTTEEELMAIFEEHRIEPEIWDRTEDGVVYCHDAKFLGACLYFVEDGKVVMTAID